MEASSTVYCAVNCSLGFTSPLEENQCVYFLYILVYHAYGRCNVYTNCFFFGSRKIFSLGHGLYPLGDDGEVAIVITVRTEFYLDSFTGFLDLSLQRGIFIQQRRISATTEMRFLTGGLKLTMQ